MHLNGITMERFGEMIRRERKERGLTLDALARKARSHKGYISEMENGKVNPGSAKLIAKLARALGLKSKDLILRAYVEKAPREIRDRLIQATFPNECESD